MIKHRIFGRGEKVYALLSSYTDPNLLIPVEAVIKDIKMDEINPQYLIKIKKFYDNWSFLKKYFFDMNFSNKFGKKHIPLKIKKDNIKSSEELVEFFDKNGDRFLFVVDSIMTTKHLKEMNHIFDLIEYFMMCKNFKELRKHMTRRLYTGKFKMTYGEFDNRLLKFFEGTFIDKSMEKNFLYILK